MARKIIYIQVVSILFNKHHVQEQKRKTCPKHPKHKLRDGIGCTLCAKEAKKASK